MFVFDDEEESFFKIEKVYVLKLIGESFEN